MNTEDVQRIAAFDSMLVVYGVFTYEDISGNSYSTIFCAMHLRTGASAHCPKYNEIH
jgi:hypothetical protein